MRICHFLSLIFLAIPVVSTFAEESLLPAHGGTGGNAYNFDCRMFGPNFVMVGISGRAGNGIEKIQARCVKADQDGGWSGSVKLTGAVGGDSAPKFIRQCDQGYAVSRISGRAGSTVTNLQIGCRKLKPYGIFSGSSVSGTAIKPSVGGTGGTTWGPDNCPDNKPARRIKGLVESVRGRVFIRQIQMSCDNPYRLPTYGDQLAAVFQHPRCTNCHAFNSNFGLGRTSHSNRGTNCTTCHTSSITGTTTWTAPGIDMNFSGMASADVCNMIKQGKFSKPSEMKHHLKEDALIIWAISNGRVPPNGNALSRAANGDIAAWNRNADTWVDTGMNCQ